MQEIASEYRVVWVSGEVNLKKKATSCLLSLTGDALTLQLDPIKDILYSQIEEVELRRIPSVGTMLQLKLPDETIFMGVPRLNVGGYLVIMNLLATRKLYAAVREGWTEALRLQTRPL